MAYFPLIVAISLMVVGQSQAIELQKPSYVPKESPKVDIDQAKITYTLWVNQEITEIHTIEIEADVNTTFYHVMELAASDPNYKFEANDTTWGGHYVTSIGGHAEDPTVNKYWMIYKVPEVPVKSNPPGDDLETEVGVDSILIADGDNYLFWLKTVNWQTTTADSNS